MNLRYRVSATKKGDRRAIILDGSHGGKGTRIRETRALRSAAEAALKKNGFVEGTARILYKNRGEEHRAYKTVEKGRKKGKEPAYFP